MLAADRRHNDVVDARLDDSIAQLEAAVRSIEAGLDHARFALAHAKRLRATGRSQAADRLVEHKLDAWLQLTAATSLLEKAVPTQSAPPRIHQPIPNVDAA